MFFKNILGLLAFQSLFAQKRTDPNPDISCGNATCTFPDICKNDKCAPYNQCGDTTCDFPYIYLFK
jgi:hypothetical protein